MKKLLWFKIYKNKQEYFQESLEMSEFEELKKLVEDSEGAISWGKLAKKGVVKIENKQVEGIYWKGYLDLRKTKIESLGKLKKVEGYLDCYDIKGLKDLGELEEVGGYCNLSGTRIESLGKLEKTGGYLYCYNLESLKDLGELEKVGGYCDLKGTRIKSLRKLKKVKGDLDCDNLESLEGLGELKEVGGLCNLSGTSINLQKEIIKKEKEGKIKIGTLIVEEILEELYKKGELDLEKFREFYGEDINKIEDKEIKKIAIEILRYEYKEKLKRIEVKIKKIIEKNKGRKLTNDEKEQIKREIKELDVELREVKGKIESFGISL